jgi:hypothetical protein
MQISNEDFQQCNTRSVTVQDSYNAVDGPRKEWPTLALTKIDLGPHKDHRWRLVVDGAPIDLTTGQLIYPGQVNRKIFRAKLFDFDGPARFARMLPTRRQIEWTPRVNELMREAGTIVAADATASV